MPKKLPDPTADIYSILDDAGLAPGTFLATRVPMHQLVTYMRSEIAQQVKAYIEQRETLVKNNKEKRNGKV